MIKKYTLVYVQDNLMYIQGFYNNIINTAAILQILTRSKVNLTDT